MLWLSCAWLQRFLYFEFGATGLNSTFETTAVLLPCDFGSNSFEFDTGVAPRLKRAWWIIIGNSYNLRPLKTLCNYAHERHLYLAVIFSSFALKKPAPTPLSTWNLFVFSGALACAKRSTMGKKIWLSMHPRNFSSEKVVRTSVRPYVRPPLHVRRCETSHFNYSRFRR